MREALPGVEIRQQTRRLQALNKGIVVATDGAHEVFAVGPGGEAYRVRPPAVSAVDATGAGDAFRAGLLAGLLKGEQLPRALCLGAAAGALKVQHLGAATTLPSADEIVALADTLTAEAVS
jgi:sugar/nucleoside kinase (ribokinase family)